MAEELLAQWGKDVKINSGYRCKKHNSTLPGASPFSYHTVGMAIDFSVPEEEQAAFAATARRVGFKGIGFYRWGVHADLGRVREWKVE